MKLLCSDMCMSAIKSFLYSLLGILHVEMKGHYADISVGERSPSSMLIIFYPENDAEIAH